MEDTESINQSALEALAQNEEYRAQTLFRQNIRKNPCHMTFSNMGVFYIFEGLFNTYNDSRRATKLGVHYLKKAEAFQKANLTLLALGNVFFEIKDYGESSECFWQACELKSDYASMYNLALSFYRRELYTEALIWFEKALGVCENCYHDEIFEAYLFSLLKIDKDKCFNELTYLLKKDITPLEIDVFVISYLCNELQAAERHIEYNFKHFDLSLEETAMTFDCLFKLDKKVDASRYLERKIESLNGYDYNVQPEVKRVKKAFSNDEYRKEIISSFRYVRPLIKQCCYYGCKIHNQL